MAHAAIRFSILKNLSESRRCANRHTRFIQLELFETGPIASFQETGQSFQKIAAHIRHVYGALRFQNSSQRNIPTNFWMAIFYRYSTTETAVTDFIAYVRENMASGVSTQTHCSRSMAIHAPNHTFIYAVTPSTGRSKSLVTPT